MDACVHGNLRARERRRALGASETIEGVRGRVHRMEGALRRRVVRRTSMPPAARQLRGESFAIVLTDRALLQPPLRATTRAAGTTGRRRRARRSLGGRASRRLRRLLLAADSPRPDYACRRRSAFAAEKSARGSSSSSSSTRRRREHPRRRCSPQEARASARPPRPRWRAAASSPASASRLERSAALGAGRVGRRGAPGSSRADGGAQHRDVRHVDPPHAGGGASERRAGVASRRSRSCGATSVSL